MAYVFAEHVEWLNPKIQGWRNYYYTNYSQKKLATLDWYILTNIGKPYEGKPHVRFDEEGLKYSALYSSSQGRTHAQKGAAAGLVNDRGSPALFFLSLLISLAEAVLE